MALITAKISSNGSWTAPADCVVNIMCCATQRCDVSIDSVRYATAIGGSTVQNVYICGEPIKAGQIITVSGNNDGYLPDRTYSSTRIAGFTV